MSGGNGSTGTDSVTELLAAAALTSGTSAGFCGAGAGPPGAVAGGAWTSIPLGPAGGGVTVAGAAGGAAMVSGGGGGTALRSRISFMLPDGVPRSVDEPEPDGFV
jgi:hypothetical protein